MTTEQEKAEARAELARLALNLDAWTAAGHKVDSLVRESEFDRTQLRNLKLSKHRYEGEIEIAQEAIANLSKLIEKQQAKVDEHDRQIDAARAEQKAIPIS